MKNKRQVQAVLSVLMTATITDSENPTSAEYVKMLKGRIARCSSSITYETVDRLDFKYGR